MPGKYLFTLCNHVTNSIIYVHNTHFLVNDIDKFFLGSCTHFEYFFQRK